MVLITGATGFLGSHLLLELLQDGEKLRALYRSPEKMEQVKKLFSLYGKEDLFASIQWFQADITDIPALEKAFEGITLVYHCAALVSFDPADEEAMRKANIEGTANIVNLCLCYSVQKLCVVSSIAALGDPLPGQDIFTESTDWNPEKSHSDYAISKYGAEMEAWRGLQEGLNVVVVNPGIILGPMPDQQAWHEGSGKIFAKTNNGLSFYTKGSSGFVWVGDVTKIMVELVKSSLCGERFILVSENVVFEDLLQSIAENLKVKPPSHYLSKNFTRFLWRLDWLANVFGAKRKLSRSMADSLHYCNKYSNEKIQKQLGYRFRPIAETIAETAAYFRKVF